MGGRVWNGPKGPSLVPISVSGVIEETRRPDVTLEIPGSSWVAGAYQGLEEVGRGVVSLRQVLNSDTRLITFLHLGDQMVVRHATNVSGPRHDMEI